MAAQNVITFFDVETTGTNPKTDQIIELSVQEGTGADAKRQTWRVRPLVPISPGAQAVHGITAKDLEHCPTFAEQADAFREIFDRADVLVGYNIDFDINFMQAEFDRLGQPQIELTGKLLLDPFLLWRRLEPRTLSDAYKRFVGQSLDDAHSAAADVAATAMVLTGMLREFQLEQRSWQELSELCGVSSRRDWIGPSHHFRWQGARPVFGFGKYRSKPITDVVSEGNADYLDWLRRSDFPPHVKKIAEAARDCSEEELKNWLAESFNSRAAD